MKKTEYKPFKTAINALILFIIDALVLNQGIISIILVLLIVFWWLPKSIVLFFQKKSPKTYLVKSAIYAVMVILVISTNILNNKIAKNRANELIDAVERYHRTNGHYPAALSELVPSYITQVPIAKYTLSFNEFWYSSSKENTSIFYVELPPFGRPTYSFTKKTWHYID